MVKITIPNFCTNFLNKMVKSLSILCDFAVASLVGVWIKTYDIVDIPRAIKSHPSWVCGLKHVSIGGVANQQTSHPSWMHGLKRRKNICYPNHFFSRTLGGVWIKIKVSQHLKQPCESHPSRMRGLKPLHSFQKE